MKRKYFYIPFLLIAFCLSCFVGCRKEEEGVLPNGVYTTRSSETRNTFVLYEGEHPEHYQCTYCWEIKGNTAQRWTSSSIDYKANIVVKDDKIYFEGCIWEEKILFSSSSHKYGSTTKYEVVYNEKAKSITLNVIPNDE